MHQPDPNRVVLAMSGGVDSSVAASLLLEQGYEVVGVFMRHGESTAQCSVPAVEPNSAGSSGANSKANSACNSALPSGGLTLPIVDPHQASKQGCCTAQDALDARRVADQLGIPFYALNLEADFQRIIGYFVDEYSAGRTPNPCVMCNNWVKFGKLFDYADGVDAKYVATGHYARLVPHPDSANVRLMRGLDDSKDQSYVLFGIERSRLSRMLLPIGGFQKAEIRRRASRLGMRVAEKRDSQEICFVQHGRHAEFVRQRTASPAGEGEIVTVDQQIVGRHQGIEGFTVGQRKGLGVAMGEPYFVVRIEPDVNRVVIGKREDLAVNGLEARQTNWLVDLPLDTDVGCLAQIRYNSPARPATLRRLPDNRLRVRFDEPTYGVAPGQAVVCYDETQVLGGGWIEHTNGPEIG